MQRFHQGGILRVQQCPETLVIEGPPFPYFIDPAFHLGTDTD